MDNGLCSKMFCLFVNVLKSPPQLVIENLNLVIFPLHNKDFSKWNFKFYIRLRLLKYDSIIKMTHNNDY